MFAVLMTIAIVTSAAEMPVPDNSVNAALSRCLGSFSAKIRPASNADQVPPGLIGGIAVNVAPIAGDERAFSYEGIDPRAMTCGVAIYGPVSGATRRRITSLIDGDPRWRRHAADAYDLSRRFPDAKETYWGDPLAPSMIGVVMLSRKPSTKAPTVEIQYHSVMVR